MSENFPSASPPGHQYPHQLYGSETTAQHVAADIAANPDMYHSGLDPYMQANGIDVQRPVSESASPSAAENATTVELSTEILKNWKYDEHGELQETGVSRIKRREAADHLLAQEGVAEDGPMTQLIAAELNTWRDEDLAHKSVDEAELARVEQAAQAMPNNERVQTHRAVIQERIQTRGDLDSQAAVNRVTEAVARELAEREGQAIERMVTERIEADKLPWTMPEAQIPPETLEAFKAMYEAVIAQQTEPLPDDVFKVAQPIERPAEGDGPYAAQDMELLRAAGIHKSGEFTREELQRAGVFFLNRVGGGEQPIFGVPVPDRDSPGGVFNVQERTFLTRAEFEKVYRFQAHSMRKYDSADVQTDMLMFALRPEPRKPDAAKSGGQSGRENKYGQMRSPFVDLGFYVKHGVETFVYTDKGKRRMNTTTIHLANAHPDYPGVSEMYDKKETAADQRYMSVEEFVDNFYIPLPSKQDVLQAMQYDLPIRRERAWVGPWPQQQGL